MNKPVIRGVSYCLIHAPNMLVHYGTTPSGERALRPDSEYLKKLPQHLRSFEEAVAYPPNQAYVGAIRPRALREIPRPWFERPVQGAERFAKYGEIMPEPEFIAMMKVVDVFDLVRLEERFAAEMTEALAAHPVMAEYAPKIGSGVPEAELRKFSHEEAAPLYLGDRLVGVVRRAHETDETLSAHVILENLVTKASAVLGLKHLFARTGLKPEEVEYLIECSEEACGDINQRGGGNFAKAIGEMAGCVNATGSDTRAFCAGPTHALIEAAALVQAGVYKHVVVLAGGTPAKLGLNSRDHVAKGMHALEDMVGAFAIHVTQDDGVSPVVRLDVVGRHKIGSGSSPQAVMQALVSEPLQRAGLRIGQVDRFGVEMQNPELTEPAGAGDVPTSNYKLIAALAVKQGEVERTALPQFVEQIGMPGFAPTQGHIPSGVPVIGSVREEIMAGEIQRAMVIGKGSLFLARMTNLFDGVSVVLERNTGRGGQAVERQRVRVGITTLGSELGAAEVVRGAEMAQRQRPDLEVVLIGTPEGVQTDLEVVPCDCIGTAHREMERLLEAGEIQAAVTLHYPFPIGVATVGRVITPGKGQEMLIATTTGTAAADRVTAMVRSAIYGVAVAKALGNRRPTVGILNVEGAPQVERALKRLAEGGYDLRWSESERADGGALMRGNDVLGGTPDVMVTDSLTGNVLMKMLSAYTTGGNYESLGYGYGPGVGEGQRHIVHIISRASGAPVIANAIAYAGDMARGGLMERLAEELAAARAAGLDALLAERGAARGAAPATGGAAPAARGTAAVPAQAGPGGEAPTPDEGGTPPAQAAPAPGTVQPPPEKVVTAEIAGVDILALDEAVELLWSRGIYARPGMGCTGPVVLVAPEDEEQARQVLSEAQYI